MELDTRASMSVICEDTYKDFSKNTDTTLQKPTSSLKTYTGHSIEVLGITTVAVRYENQSANLKVHVVAGVGPILFGRDWL